MSATIVPKSDQLNADDLMSGSRTVTITGVSKGSAEQPVDIALAEFPGRAYRPAKSMRRVMVELWGPDASVYVGRRLTLYREPGVRFGGEEVGGIRISHMSHLDRKRTVALTVTRGRRAPFTVEPLPDAAPPNQQQEAAPEISDDEATDFARDIAESSTMPELDAVATALKSCNLGAHRKSLLDAWTARKTEVVADAQS